MKIEEVKEYAYVFEAGVHALAVERDHGVGGVAEDDDGGAVVVGCTFDADEWEVGVVSELELQVVWINEFGGNAGEVIVEKRKEVGLWRVGEVGEMGRRSEECACEGFVEGWDGDEHELAAWPDVKVVWGYPEVASWRWWD